MPEFQEKCVVQVEWAEFGNIEKEPNKQRTRKAGPTSSQIEQVGQIQREKTRTHRQLPQSQETVENAGINRQTGAWGVSHQGCEYHFQGGRPQPHQKIENAIFEHQNMPRLVSKKSQMG